jgi:hypothetical protein
MDIQAISTAAIALLSPYLAKAGGAFAEKAGEKLAEKAGALHQAIKKKFEGDAYAKQTLARVEERPESEGRKVTLQEVLSEKLEEDTDFAEVVRHLVEEAKVADTHKVIAFGERSVAIGGDVSGSTTIITGDGNVVGDGSTSRVIKAEGGSTISDVRQEINK